MSEAEEKKEELAEAPARPGSGLPRRKSISEKIGDTLMPRRRSSIDADALRIRSNGGNWHVIRAAAKLMRLLHGGSKGGDGDAYLREAEANSAAAAEAAAGALGFEKEGINTREYREQGNDEHYTDTALEAGREIWCLHHEEGTVVRTTQTRHSRRIETTCHVRIWCLHHEEVTVVRTTRTRRSRRAER